MRPQLDQLERAASEREAEAKVLRLRCELAELQAKELESQAKLMQEQLARYEWI